MITEVLRVSGCFHILYLRNLQIKLRCSKRIAHVPFSLSLHDPVVNCKLFHNLRLGTTSVRKKHTNKKQSFLSSSPMCCHFELEKEDFLPLPCWTPSLRKTCPTGSSPFTNVGCFLCCGEHNDVFTGDLYGCDDGEKEPDERRERTATKTWDRPWEQTQALS